jgi:hypothetical protein
MMKKQMRNRRFRSVSHSVFVQMTGRLSNIFWKDWEEMYKLKNLEKL